MSEIEEKTIADELSAAFDAVENVEPSPESEPMEAEAPADTQTASAEDDVSRETTETAPESAETDEKTPETESKAPETPEEDAGAPPGGWKPAAREMWKAIPKQVRDEVQRREREISTTMQQLTDVRKFADNFAQTIYPFREHIRREGATPLSAVQSLLQTAASLQTGDSRAKAVQIATLVARYGVDVRELDEALASGVGREEPIVAQRVAEAVRPFQEQLAQQQAELASRQQATTSTVQQELAAFSSDPANEFFNDVRLDMADVMDAAARRGQTISFKDAYDKACQMNPDVAPILAQRKETEMARKRAEEAKRKKFASKSVPSASAGDQRRRVAESTSAHDDLRADLEHALSARQ